jgi:hypothetical protein
MDAIPGDWLIVRIAGTDHAARCARILEVSSPDGAPPFRVRWLDTGLEGLVLPGADAYVVTEDELRTLDTRMVERAAVVPHPTVRQRSFSPAGALQNALDRRRTGAEIPDVPQESQTGISGAG